MAIRKIPPQTGTTLGRTGPAGTPPVRVTLAGTVSTSLGVTGAELSRMAVCLTPVAPHRSNVVRNADRHPAQVDRTFHIVHHEVSEGRVHLHNPSKCTFPFITSGAFGPKMCGKGFINSSAVYPDGLVLIIEVLREDPLIICFGLEDYYLRGQSLIM